MASKRTSKLQSQVMKSSRSTASLPLPLKDVATLPDELIIQFICEQGKVLRISDWEVNCLVDLCQRKKCLIKALEVLSEYAGLQDASNISMEAVIAGFRELRLHVEDSSADISRLDMSKISYLIDSTARDIVSLCISLSSWRKLQSSPILLGPFGSVTTRTAAASLSVQLRENARRFLHLLSPIIQKLAPSKELQFSIILCGAFSDQELDNRILSSGSSFCVQRMVLEVRRTIRGILAIEDRICSTWDALSMTFSKDQEQFLSLLPVLRLPYENLRSPITDFEWFLSASGDFYHSAISELKSCFQLLNLNIYPSNTLGIVSQSSCTMLIPQREISNQTQDSPPHHPILQRKKSKSTPVMLSEDIIAALKMKEQKRHTLTGTVGSSGRSNTTSTMVDRATVNSSSITPAASVGENLKVFKKEALDCKKDVSSKQLSPSAMKKGNEGKKNYKKSSQRSSKGTSNGRCSPEIIFLPSSKPSLDIETHHPLLRKSVSEALIKPSDILQLFEDDDELDEDEMATPIASTRRTSQEYISRPNSANSRISRPNSADINIISGRASGNARHFSKSLQVLELYSSLLSPLSRAEARAESQLVNITLRDIRIDGATIVALATVKIQIWWRLHYPRMRLRKRLSSVNFARDIIFSIVNQAEIIGLRRKRTKTHFQKIGAVVKIQKLFRHWKNTVLIRIWKIKKAWRRSRARIRVRKLVNQVRAGMMVFRFILGYFKRKKLVKKLKRLNLKQILQGFLSSIGIISMNNSLSFKNEGDEIIATIVRQRLILEDQNDPNTAALDYANPQTRETRLKQLQEVTKKKVYALIVKLQSLIRMALAKRRIQRTKKSKASSARLSQFCFAIRMRSTLHKKSNRRRMAIRIQKALRGYIVRSKLTRRLRASFRILQAYRSYKAYRNLKQNLRRIEHTFKFTFRMLRGLPMQMIHSSEMSMKVSVWWHPLLHIVNERDYGTITSSKNPQLIHMSSPSPIFRPKISSIDANSVDQQSSSGKSIAKFKEAISRVSVMNSLNSAQKKTPPAGSLSAIAPVPVPALAPKPLPRTLSALAMIAESDDDDDGGDGDDDDNNEGGGGAKIVDSKVNDREDSEFGDDENDDNSSSDESEGEKRTAEIKKKAALEMIRNSMANTSPAKSSSPASLPPVNMLTRFSMLRKSMVSPIFGSKSAEAVPVELAETYSCTFGGSSFYIPGCHGNCVMRFEFFDGNRAFATSSFFMSKFGKLMYWGGDHSCPVSITQINRRGNQSSTNRIIRKANDREEPVLFDFSIQAGRPNRSKSQWARVSFKGLIGAKQRGFSMMNFFERWDRVFVTFDGDFLSLFNSKNASSVLHQIETKNIKQVTVELGKSSFNAQKAVVEDTHEIVIVSTHGNQMHLRFPDTKSREAWKVLIEQAMKHVEEEATAAAATAAKAGGATSSTADKSTRRFSLWKSPSIPKI